MTFPRKATFVASASNRHNSTSFVTSYLNALAAFSLSRSSDKQVTGNGDVSHKLSPRRPRRPWVMCGWSSVARSFDHIGLFCLGSLGLGLSGSQCNIYSCKLLDAKCNVTASIGDSVANVRTSGERESVVKTILKASVGGYSTTLCGIGGRDLRRYSCSRVKAPLLHSPQLGTCQNTTIFPSLK